MVEGQPHLTVIETDQARIVEFADRKILEELSIAEIGDELSKLVQDYPGLNLLLSFQHVEHLSSAALGMLITLNKEIEGKSGKLKLSEIAPQIYEVFKITRLNKLFDIYDSRDEALKSF